MKKDLKSDLLTEPRVQQGEHLQRQNDDPERDGPKSLAAFIHANNKNNDFRLSTHRHSRPMIQTRKSKNNSIKNDNSSSNTTTTAGKGRVERASSLALHLEAIPHLRRPQPYHYQKHLYKYPCVTKLDDEESDLISESSSSLLSYGTYSSDSLLGSVANAHTADCHRKTAAAAGLAFSRNHNRARHPRQRRVRFSVVQIQEYNVILGDHPGASAFPMSLDWQHTAVQEVDLMTYETETGAAFRQGLGSDTAPQRLTSYDRCLRLAKVAGLLPSDLEAQEEKRQRGLGNDLTIGTDYYESSDHCHVEPNYRHLICDYQQDDDEDDGIDDVDEINDGDDDEDTGDSDANKDNYSDSDSLSLGSIEESFLFQTQAENGSDLYFSSRRDISCDF